MAGISTPALLIGTTYKKLTYQKKKKLAYQPIIYRNDYSSIETFTSLSHKVPTW